MSYHTTVEIDDYPFEQRRKWTLDEYREAVVKAARYQFGLRPAEEPIVKTGFEGNHAQFERKSILELLLNRIQKKDDHKDLKWV